MVPRIREVASKVRLLIEDLRRAGISDSELVLGMILAVQAMPATRALTEHPEVAKTLKKFADFARAGAALFDPDSKD